VGSELAQRYQASVKRIGNASRHISTALLANHYNVDLERVQQIAQAFTKTSIVSLSDPTPNAMPSATPTPSKGKEKALTNLAAKNTAKSHANDLVAVITSDDKRWAGWGDVRIQYYPDDSKGNQGAITEPGKSSQPSTPTPLRRSSTMGATQQTPKGRNPPGDDSSPLWPRTPGPGEDAEVSGQKAFELPQSMVVASTMSQLLDKLPADMPQSSKYEAFHRFRVAKALTGSPLARQQILATRLLAITNLAYIHTESSFVEKVLRQDMDETRRYQLVYQLAELIHPSTEGNIDIPLWLQTFALGLLEAVSSFHSRCQDVLSALNANVNHGVLLYVIRKAVAGMEQDEGEGDYEQVTEIDNWRNNLFSLTLNLSMATRVGAEMASAGLMDILVHILNIRSKVAERHHSMVLAFLDGLIWAYPNAFNAFFTADGLDSVSKLVVDTVADSKKLVAANNGIKPDQQSSAVDYEVPYYHQQTLKWLLKFIHRVMSNSYNYSGNTERLLRNLAEKSDLLAGLRQVISDKKCFGSVIWTNSVMILSDFINNDPTSYVAISESGMIRTYLEAVTGKPLAESALEEDAKGETEHEENDTSESAAVTAMIERDDRSHPPTEEMLRAADATAPKTAGILATSEAINVVPQVLNSISLNTSGMKLVIASQALDSYFEIFESPEHVRCMELDIDLAGTVGGSFDELARHHPPLRTAISNAVIDMVARVRHLGIQKAENAGWGARLFANDGDGKMVSINEQGNVDNARSASQKGKAPSQPDQPVDSDVAMLDLTTSTSVETEDKDGESDAGSAHESFTPYIYAVSNFLTTYVSSSFLKNNFIDKGGIELLLDICESPSLPANYGDSMASRVLNQVISMLLEQAPVRGLPSLLRRAQSAIDVLQPLSSKAEAVPPYFGPFLGTDISLTSAAAPENMRNGTKIIKALLNAQTFIKIVSECFSTSRSHSLQFYPVNVYDYYVVLVRSMGPLLRGVLAEEAGELSAVPQHWSLKRRGAVSEGDTRSGSDAATEHTSLPDVMKDTGSWNTAEGSDAPTAPTEEEQSTARYQNYETLRLLLHPMIPTSFPLFQSLGKALLPKRELTHGDTYPLPRQRQIAKELAATVLNHLSPSVASNEPGSKEFHYWIIMLHTIHEMLIDHPTGRGLDRANVHIILPVLLAFKEQKGLDVLNSMLKIFAAAVREGGSANTDESSKSKVAAFGLKKVLDLYGVLVNGKNIIDTHTQFNPLRLTDRTQTVPHIFQQLVVELRYAVLPVLLDLWDSPFVEHVSDATAKRLLDILKQISAAEHEPPITPKDKVPFQLLNYTDVRFDWTPLHGTIDDLRSAGYEESLVHEAVFRANGNLSASREYCRAHKAGLAGDRNPIPAEDADVNASRSSEQSTSRQRAPSGAGVSEADRMSLDTFTEEAGESGRDDGESISASAVSRSASNHSTSGGGKAAPADESQRGQFPGTKEDLDKLRAKLRGNLIDQSLDVIRIHPDSAIEVSELIHTMVLQNQDQDAQEEVGSTLTFALSSLAMDGEEKKKNGKCIAAYAHLLALLLQDENFFEYNLDVLRDKVDEYVAFLKIPPSGSGEELPPWIPYILLVLEPLLSHDERPVAAQWKPPKTLEGEVASPVVQLGASLVDDQQRTDILDSLLDLLPRVGKEEVLATSILRILVILTRRRRLAKHVGEKKNLQRLFLMAKQLSGHGAERLKQIKLTAHIITVLRHVIEDEEVLRQIIRAEIKAEFPAVQRNNRGHADIAAFLRTMAPVALRSPELFVEVANEMLRFSRWTPPGNDANRPNAIALKSETGDGVDAPAIDNSSQPAEAATSTDVKPSTEVADKDMADAPKLSDSKRPVVENPDGVVHFLLCELVNYREVDDKEPTVTGKETQLDLNLGNTSSESIAKEESTPESKDKKPTKPQFKAEEHPIFVYRCFLLNCLSELLQSYTRAKVEFINFKRSAPPLSTGTPIKPRTSILNYLIYDLLCQSTLTGSVDNIVAKKKAATSAQTQKVLVALVSKTSERPVDQKQGKFVYDEEPDLLFVRKFVLDTILRAYEKTPNSDESMETRYARLQCLAELMISMIGDKDREQRPPSRTSDKIQSRSQAQLRRLMYEKGYLDKLTSSIAELNLNYPGVKRAIKYVLRVLRILTDTAKELSHTNLVPSDPQADQSEDDFESTSSLSDLDDDREETPDLYRNSALGMLEPRGEDDESESDDEDHDADMYGDEYDEEMDYGDEEMSDGEDDISDEDEELGEMGEIEGLHGDPGVVEVIMDDDDGEDDDEDEEDDSDTDEDEDGDSADMDDMDDRVEIIDEDGNPIEDDPEWESESEIGEADGDVDDIDYEGAAQDDDEAHLHGMGPRDLLDNMARAIMGDGDGYEPELMEGMDEHYLDDDHEDIGKSLAHRFTQRFC
jgi:E3 ubiquitin-protein ligase HUWE1